MNTHRGFQFGLLLLILAAFSGLIGFVVVYHYATYERQVQHFAFVIDAGSTQTRSSLFSINLDAEALAQYSDSNVGNQSVISEPLNKLFQVQQVDSCVNGGPLASIKSPAEAHELVKECLEKFSRRIKQLDLSRPQDDSSSRDELGTGGWTSGDEADELTSKNGRMNSVTYLYLGATAGMRALNELNQTLANQKLKWMDKAISEVNTLKAAGPFINKGFVGILKGSDEAAYGWTSVNFVCDQLKAIKSGENQQVLVDPLKQQTLAYQTTPQQLLPINHEVVATVRGSVGTLELGGASSQMAHEVSVGESLEKLGRDYQVRELDLFNTKYKLVTRSDLCFGMSQATLRANFVLLRDYYNATRQFNSSSSVMELIEPTNSHTLELINPCLQKNSKVELVGSGSSSNGTSIRDFLQGSCLVDAIQDDFKSYLLRKSEILFVGTGNVNQCHQLLAKLLDPKTCHRYFQLCPSDRNKQPPPANMSFVTISGYNKALQILNLRRAPVKLGSSHLTTSTELTIAAKLGGYSVEHEEFVNLTKDFCLQDVDQFSSLYPNMNKKFYAINCLQLVYIDKLLTEFYQFKPETSWRQIKFLVFPQALPISNGKLVEQQTEQQQEQQDIGWTLGLLLNATSQQYNAGDNSADQTIFHHHSSSVLFVLRATIFLILACILLATSLIVIGILAVRHHHRKAYISHPLEEGLRA